MCAAARREPVRPTCSSRIEASSGLTPWRYPAGLPSAWTRPPGVQALLREKGRGFAIGDIRVPIVCGAVLFDLLNGGNKKWGRYPVYRELGYAAAAAADRSFALGTAGAGFGATTVNLKGGLGSASALTRDGHMVGALVAVNACGSVNIGGEPHFWAAPFELDGEFGGLGFPVEIHPAALTPLAKGRPGGEHHDRGRCNRCRAHQGTSQGTRSHGPGRLCPRHIPGAYDTRR